MNRPDTRPDDESTIDGEMPFRGMIRYEQQLPVRQVSYYLCGEIVEPQLYTEMFYTLRTASDTDLVYLHLNSSGGDFNTGLQIINNILASNAHVVTILEARAYSMAALIFLAGDELIVHDNCQLMFHTYSGYFSGKGHEQQAESQAIASWFGKVMNRLCRPFLTENEVAGIIKGGDLWMDSDDITRRLTRMKRAQTTAAHQHLKEKPAVAKKRAADSPAVNATSSRKTV